MAEHPEVGELMFADPNGRIPVTITRVEGTFVNYVPAGTELRGTHKGNLYNKDGEHPYRDSL